MKTSSAILHIFLLALLCSCKGQQTTNADGSDEQKLSEPNAVTEVLCFEDSCQHLVVKLSLELPLGTDEASMLMRDSLIADFMANCRQPGYDQENEFGIKPYEGDMTDVQAIVDYYGKADYDFLLENSIADYDERMQCIDENTTLSEEEKEQIKSNVPQWCFELTTQKTADTQGFVVYHSQAYVYYGGAHGGITGSGALTFDKSSGKKIARFVKDDATAALQPMIRKGLVQYFTAGGDSIDDSRLDDCLFITDDIIPQPVSTPCPNATGDSLVFTYRQYEIACYAAGMPTFTLSVQDLMPYLTEEGKVLVCDK